MSSFKLKVFLQIYLLTLWVYQVSSTVIVNVEEKSTQEEQLVSKSNVKQGNNESKTLKNVSPIGTLPTSSSLSSTLPLVLTPSASSTLSSSASSSMDIDSKYDVKKKKIVQTMLSEPYYTGWLQQQLIQRFAGEYKQIPRVTFFTCRLPAPQVDAEANFSQSVVQEQKYVEHFHEKNFELLKHLNTIATMENELLDIFVRLVHMDRLGNVSGIKITDGRWQTITNTNWLENILKYEDLRHIAVVDLACGAMSRKLLELASNIMPFSSKLHWLLIEDYSWHVSSIKYSRQNEASQLQIEVKDASEQDEHIEKFMEKLDLYVSSELTLAKRMSDYYKLYDVWNPGLQYGGRINITEIGYFTLTKGFQIYDWFRTTTMISRRKDMQLAKIRTMNVVTNKNLTGTLEHYLTTPYDVHIDTMNRFNFNLLLCVRDMFNMSFILLRSPSWGYLKNGKFDGMIGALIRKQADIGGSPIFYFLERHKFIDAASRTWTSRTCFIFRHPKSTTKDRIVFLQPFSNNIWLVLAFCGLLTVFILWLLTTMEAILLQNSNEFLIKPKGYAAATHQKQLQKIDLEGNIKNMSTCILYAIHQPKIQKVPNEFFRRVCHRLLALVRYNKQQKQQRKTVERQGLFLESVLFFVGIICQQGLGFNTRFLSGRCIVITTLLFSFSIYQFYSASIVGTLLMPKPKTIRTLLDLVHSSLQVGIEDILYNREFFLRTKDPVAMELYAKKITSIPSSIDNSEIPNNLPDPAVTAEFTADKKEKYYRNILHSHESGAHAKANDASNWLDSESGMCRVKKGRFAFHVDTAAAYKIIAETFTEREICDLVEINLFPPQKTVSILQKDSPLRKVISYGLRRTMESGIMDYQIQVWRSRKPPCIKKLETSDLHVDMETVSSALLMLIFGYLVALCTLVLEILHFRRKHKLNKF